MHNIYYKYDDKHMKKWTKINKSIDWCSKNYFIKKENLGFVKNEVIASDKKSWPFFLPKMRWKEITKEGMIRIVKRSL